MPCRIPAAGAQVTETYIDFFTATIRNRNTRQAYARAWWQFFDWCPTHGSATAYYDLRDIPLDRLLDRLPASANFRRYLSVAHETLRTSNPSNLSNRPHLDLRRTRRRFEIIAPSNTPCVKIIVKNFR
jgi:hypothetical protein